jgi:large subunit ribosomal protein L3
MSTTETTTEQSQNSSGSTADMPKFILGRKQGMTQVFKEDGSVQPATKVQAGPLVITQVKTVESDGYQAYQLGFDETDKADLPDPQRGHQEAAFAETDTDSYYSVLREYRFQDGDDLPGEVGDRITARTFTVGDTVDVSGVSKGKGFQGVVARHGFSGGPRTHGGQKSPERGPGSIGATGPSHVRKGTKMAGRGGGKKTTVQNLEIVHIDEEEDVLYIRGGLPGPDGGLLEVTSVDK